MTDQEYIKKLEEALYDSLALNINWVSTALKSDLEYHSEYAAVIKQAKETLKLSKNPKMHNMSTTPRLKPWGLPSSKNMKFKVSYYDYDTDKYVMKDCDRMEFKDGNFSFYPVDNPVKIYKSIVIDHPKVAIYQDRDRMKIIVTGYQYMNDGGYWRTETIIENVRED